LPPPAIPTMGAMAPAQPAAFRILPLGGSSLALDHIGCPENGDHPSLLSNPVDQLLKLSRRVMHTAPQPEGASFGPNKNSTASLGRHLTLDICEASRWDATEYWSTPQILETFPLMSGLSNFIKLAV
jgi:hypothetical protein